MLFKGALPAKTKIFCLPSEFDENRLLYVKNYAESIATIKNCNFWIFWLILTYLSFSAFFDRNPEKRLNLCSFYFSIVQTRQNKANTKAKVVTASDFQYFDWFSSNWGWKLPKIICQIVFFFFSTFYNMTTRLKYEKKRPILPFGAFDLQFDIFTIPVPLKLTELHSFIARICPKNIDWRKRSK